MVSSKNNMWSELWKLKIALKLRCCANLSAFWEEYNGDSEDARIPFNNMFTTFNNCQTPSNTFKAMYT
eukprot:11380904-Heterocapsa_arctica.AAC.1